MRLALVTSPQDSTTALPTVGDTIWVGRTVAVPPGATLRPADWDAPEPIERLGPPRVTPRGDSADVSYPIVVWRTGPLTIDLPGPLLLGAGGRVDSLPPQVGASSPSPACCPRVPPDSTLAPQPRADFVPRTSASPVPLLVLLVAGGAAAGAAPLVVAAARIPASAAGAAERLGRTRRRSSAGPTRARSRAVASVATARLRVADRRAHAGRRTSGSTPRTCSAPSPSGPTGRSPSSATCFARSTRPGSATRPSRMRSGWRAGPTSSPRASPRRPHDASPARGCCCSCSDSPVWWWRRRRGETPAARYSDVSIPAAVSARRWWVAVPPVLRAVSLAALIVAAAGPRIGGDTIEVKQEGIAIVITIDISSSMLAEDFAPSNRLAVAQRQAVAFIRGRTADRIGLVAFAGEALTQVPVTLDYPVVEQAVMDLQIGSLEDGTAIGSGLATAVNRLRRAPDKSKVVLLLTDGENNKGLIDPRTAAATAAAYGIRVYTIGVGTIGEAPIPTGRGLGGFRYELLPVRIDEPLLREIAAKTGGRYFRARDSEALSRIFRQIDQLEKTPIQVTRYTKYEEATRPLVLLGLAALALELLLGSTLVVRVP